MLYYEKNAVTGNLILLNNKNNYNKNVNGKWIGQNVSCINTISVNGK